MMIDKHSTWLNKNTFLISSAFFFIFFGFGTAQQYLAILFSAQGRGHLALGALFILYSFFLLTGIFTAKIIPRIGGLKRSLIAGAFTYFLFVAGAAFSNAALLYVVSVFIGVGAGLLWVSSGQIIIDNSGEHNAGRNLSFQMIGLYGGNILGVYLGAYLVTILPLAYFYLILAAIIFLGIFLLFGVRPAKEEVRARPFKPYFMFSRKMLVLFPLIFGANFLQAQVFTGMNFIIVGLLGMSSVALLVTIVKASNIMGSFSSGTLSGRFSKAVLLAALVFMALLGIFLLVGTQSRGLVFLSIILLGFSMASIYPVCLAWLKEKLPSEEYLYALGVFHVYSNLGALGAIAANIKLSAQFSFIPGVAAFFLALPGIILFQKQKKIIKP